MAPKKKKKSSPSEIQNETSPTNPESPSPSDPELLMKKAKELVDWMVAHPQDVIQERKNLQEKMMKKRCIYGESLLPTTLMPMFFKKESLEKIETVSVIIDRIVDKAVRLYFQEEKVREYFPYPQLPREWIEADPGYEKPTVINRHDALYDGKDLKFIEFNTDNPGGKGWTDIYEELFLEHSMYQDLIGKFSRPLHKSITKGYYDSVLSCYKEMNFQEKPRVALVDFREVSTRTESEILRDYFIEHDVEANLIDARDFELKKGRLYSNGVCFPIALRTLKAQFYMRYPKEMKDFIEGTKNKACCLINPFRSVIGSEKSMLAFLTNPFHHHFFTPEEVEVIQNHIPWTRRLDELITQSPEGEEIDLKYYMKKNRERLVLKPSWGAGGYQVTLGKSTERAEWEDMINEYQGCPWWTVQEAVNIPSLEFPVIRGNKIVLEKKFYNFSPFVFGGKYVGILGRTSTKDVINVSAGGGVIPVFAMK